MLDTPLMLWELSVTEQRYRAVLEVLAGVPVTEVADQYGVSRQSVHAWLVRYRDEGPPGLEERSHKVHRHPWQIPADLEAAVCELRRAHRKWGPKRLVFEMGRRGLGTVTRSTVYRVLVRNQLIEPRSRRRRRQDYIRWERPVPMQLWQLDVTASAPSRRWRRGEDRDHLEDATRQAITGLRQSGYSWADIAMRLGITRQGAQQRWGDTPPSVTDTSSTAADRSCP